MYAEKSREFRLTSRLEFESRAALQEFYIGDLSAYSLGAKRNSTFRTGSFRLILSASFPSTCRQAFEESISISIARWMAKIRPCVAISWGFAYRLQRIVAFACREFSIFFFVKVFVISSTIIRFSDEFFTHVHSFRNRKILTFEGVNRCQEQSVGGEIFSKRAKNIGVKTCFENTDLAKQVA